MEDYNSYNPLEGFLAFLFFLGIVWTVLNPEKAKALIEKIGDDEVE